MKVFNLIYNNSGIEGTAIVYASNAKRATIVLQSTGRLNASRYKVTSITEVGCNDSPIEKVQSEVWSGEVSDSKIDINQLTDEQIEQLGFRLNKELGTIYVNRIHSYYLLNPDDFKPNAQDGYTFLYIDPSRGNWKTKSGLYTKVGGKNIWCGYPTKYKYVESAARIAEINYAASEVWYPTGFAPSSGAPPIIYSIKNKYENLGLFLRKRGKGFGKTKRPTAKTPRNATWQCLDYSIQQHALDIIQSNYDERLIRKYLLKWVVANYDDLDKLNTRVRRFKCKAPGSTLMHFVFKVAIGVCRTRQLSSYNSGNDRPHPYRMKGIPIKEYIITLRSDVLEEAFANKK